jgi:hypothetical protein
MAGKSTPASSNLPIPLESVERRIFVIRSQKVMIDTDLAKLYQVATKRLNEQVRRNQAAFQRISCSN